MFYANVNSQRHKNVHETFKLVDRFLPTIEYNRSDCKFIFSIKFFSNFLSFNKLGFEFFNG